MTDPDLGTGCVAVRRIPCGCKACIDQLKLPWDCKRLKNDQPRYAQNKSCTRWDIFQGVNDWDVVQITHTKDDDEKLIEK